MQRTMNIWTNSMNLRSTDQETSFHVRDALYERNRHLKNLACKLPGWRDHNSTNLNMKCRIFILKFISDVILQVVDNSFEIMDDCQSNWRPQSSAPMVAKGANCPSINTAAMRFDQSIAQNLGSSHCNHVCQPWYN